MFRPGDIIGPYRIEREIGRGGMAIVYLAYHQRLERPVALKVLFEHLRGDSEFVNRFLVEARAAARLDHPNIVAIHDAGQIGGIDYIAMEYVEGESLGDILQRVGGALPLDFVFSAINQVADALDYAHRQGIIHRDIKPSNILIRPNGHALLTDFGIARAGGPSNITHAGVVLGTPEYMSPEQAQGREVDGRSDLYSLAIVAYHMLTGRTPYRGAAAQATLYAHIHQDLPDPRSFNPQLPPALPNVLRIAAAKDPSRRYTSCSVFAQALRNSPYVAAASKPPVRRKSSPVWLYVIIGLLIGLAAISFTVYFMLFYQSSAQANRPLLPRVPAAPAASTAANCHPGHHSRTGIPHHHRHLPTLTSNAHRDADANPNTSSPSACATTSGLCFRPHRRPADIPHRRRRRRRHTAHIRRPQRTPVLVARRQPPLLHQRPRWQRRPVGHAPRRR